MKKKTRKLKLNRETLSMLGSQALTQAAGGWRSVIRGGCGGGGDTALTCETCLTCDWSCPGQTCDCETYVRCPV